MRATLRELWGFFWVRVAAVAAAAVALLWGLEWVWSGARSAVNTVVIAFVFAYVCNPLVDWFERRRLSRGLGILTVFVIVLLFLGLATVLLASMAGQLSQFVGSLPAQVAPLLEWIQRLPDQIGQIELPPVLRDALTQATNNLQTLLQAFSQTLLRGLQTLLAQGGNLLGFVSGLLGGFFQLFTALTLAIYLLSDFRKIGQTLFEVVPEPYQPRFAELAGKAHKAFGGFIQGSIIGGFATGGVITVAMYVAFGLFQGFGGGTLTQAMSLGFLAFVFSFIPVVGVLISAVPAILLALPLGLWGVVAVTVALWLCNQAQGIIGPIIMRYTVSLHPVTGIAAALIGGSLFGVFGAILSTPVVAFVKTLYTDYYRPSRFYKEG